MTAKKLVLLVKVVFIEARYYVSFNILIEISALSQRLIWFFTFSAIISSLFKTENNIYVYIINYWYVFTRIVLEVTC